MLYVNCKKATRIQNVTFSLYQECLELKMTIDEYKKCVDFNSNYIDDILDKGRLVSVLLKCLRYRITIGIANLLDTNKKCLSVYKMLNLYEQIDNKELNKEVQKAKVDLEKYNVLKNNVKEMRDKMYAHIDIVYLLEEGDLFDIDVDALIEQLDNSLELIKYIMILCEKLSEKSDGDSLHIKMKNMFNL